MDRKTLSRLTGLERNHLETNRRLDEVIKSNLNLQRLLEIVVSNQSRNDEGRRDEVFKTSTPAVKETVTPAEASNTLNRRESAGKGSSEQWWDDMCKSTDDDLDACTIVAPKPASHRQQKAKVNQQNP